MPTNYPVEIGRIDRIKICNLKQSASLSSAKVKMDELFYK